MAFVLEGYKFGTQGFGTSGGTVTWSFATSNFANEPYSYSSFLTGQFQTEIRAALAAWETVANIDFVEVTDSASSLLRFGFVNDFPAFPWSPAIAGGVGGVAGQAAVSYMFGAPANLLTEADIAFDAREGWQIINGEILTGPGGTRFFSIALHEIGHAIGLDHDDTPGERSIMKSTLDPSYNGLEAVDIAGARAIYGAAATQPAGSVSIGDVIITEGNAGTQVATFTVVRTGGTAAFTVNFATANNSATAGSDYQATSGTLTFANGVNQQTISVVINGDTVVEPSESFFVNLSGATNGATIADSQGIGTISNDDVAGSVSIGDVIITEGNAGTQVATFVVNRTGGTAPFTVNFATADNTATAGSDYQAASGTLTFGAGVAQQTISVVINGDTVLEASESFFVNLSGATNGAGITDSQGVGTISNDDTAAVAGSVSIGDVIITEGDAGTRVATFMVSRTNGTAAFTVNYATANNTATAGSDYQATSGTLSFAAGTTQQTISVVINGDTVVEASESFFLNLSGATNGAGITDSQGVGTISNDDTAAPAGSVSIGDVIIVEGDAGTKVATFIVSRTNGTAAFTVNYATANNTATAGSDYQATSGTLSFAAGATQQTISVVINGDTVLEASESFFLNLSGATNGAGIADSQGVGTISNDDTGPVTGSVSIGDVIIVEGDAGTKVATFIVSRTNGTAAFTVNYATANNTATAGSDYQATSGTLSFAAGATQQTISVVINGDTVVEASESFFLNLSGATNGAGITDSQGVGTISNDDTGPVTGSVSIGDVVITEGDAGTRVATFTVTRTGGTSPFKVNFATADNGATAGSDYKAASGTLSFASGVNTKTISVTITGDLAAEATERFFVNLFNATNGVTIADAQGVGTISDDDASQHRFFLGSNQVLDTFAPNAGGWTSDDLYPRHLADVNGDGKADIVGFGGTGVYVSLATGGGNFAEKTFELAQFAPQAGGWNSDNLYPRKLADVNGDGKADIVAFGSQGAYVSLATSNGHFADPTFEFEGFATKVDGWTSDDKFPRELADVNGDGMADIVGFGGAGVYVALATGNGHFADSTFELAAFAPKAGGWNSDNKSHRELGDVNGDGMADIVGFGGKGVYVALATGGGHFAEPTFEFAQFAPKAGGWTSDDSFPRKLADVNGDGMADIVGFGGKGVYVALATGDGHFADPLFDLAEFGLKAGGWTSDNLYPRELGDVTGDGLADIVAFGSEGVHVALAHSGVLL